MSAPARIFKVLSFMFVIALLAQPLLAQSGIKIFVKIDNIKGESTDDRHKEEIDAVACSEGVLNSITIGSPGGGSSSRPDFSDIKIIKGIDAASPLLRLAVAKGTHYPHVTITFERMSPIGTRLPFLVIKLETVAFTEVSMTTQVSDVAQEIVALTFAKITWTYTPSTKDGTPIETSYDRTKIDG